MTNQLGRLAIMSLVLIVNATFIIDNSLLD